MFCPQCRTEYREGFEECSDCKVVLVPELPKTDNDTNADPDDDFITFKTVLTTGNPAIIAVAKSMLESADIPYFAKGEGVQTLFGAGSMGTGFNPLTGPIEIQVDEERFDEAQILLEDLEEEIPDADG